MAALSPVAALPPVAALSPVAALPPVAALSHVAALSQGWPPMSNRGRHWGLPLPLRGKSSVQVYNRTPSLFSWLWTR